MSNYFLEGDINVICIKADSFPAGVLTAHQKLQALTGNDKKRKYFGISYPEGPGNIIYKAAAEEQYAGEAADLHCERFTIRKGQYSSIYISNFMNDIPAIGNAFRQLLAQTGIDPNGYCLEIYEGENDVRCLVPLKN
jgi:predicted transcriptional regulator YdeE